MHTHCVTLITANTIHKVCTVHIARVNDSGGMVRGNWWSSVCVCVCVRMCALACSLSCSL